MKQMITFTYDNGAYAIKNRSKNPSVMWMLSNMFTVRYIFYIDRFNVFDDNDYDWYHYPMKENFEYIKNQKKMSFEECCRKRTDEIIDIAKSLNKDIYVSWSGGVDSTCIVSSFLMNERLDKSRFHILYNDNSINEYPVFYNILKTEKINLYNCEFKLDLFETIPKDNLVINGCCGDKMEPNSTIDLLKYFKDNLWEKVIIQICNSLGYTNIDYYINSFHKYIDYFGIPIKTFSELSWLLEFGCEWRRTSEFRKILSKYPEYRISFYDTTQFEKYALDRFNNVKCGVCFFGPNYKKPFKKIIYKYTKDEYYYLYKGKEAYPFINSTHNNKVTLYYKDNTGYHQKPIIDKKDFYNFIIKYYKEDVRQYIDIVDRGNYLNE